MQGSFDTSELQKLSETLKVDFSEPIPSHYFGLTNKDRRSKNVPHAPKRNPSLTEK